MPASFSALVYLGAAFHAVLGVWHLAFSRIFDWKNDLAKLKPINRAVMQILNICLAFVFLCIAGLEAVFGGELLAGAVGRAMLLGIGLFWALRLVLQFVFFGARSGRSLALAAMFALATGLHIGLLFATR